MGERTSYPPGTFSWVDLATTDVQGAKSFYSGLFGWEIEDMHTGDGGVYSMARLDGKDVAALSTQREEERELGAPPHWNSYATVEDVDAAAAKVAELGGQVFVPAFDVLDAGRMAVIADPTGAFLMLWQPKNHIGAGIAASKAGKLGATKLAGPMDVPTTEGARIAILTDPQGAAFALAAGPLDD